MSTSRSGTSSSIDDLTILVAFTLAAAIALLLPGVPWVVEWAFGLPLLLWIPGYAIVAALFPTAPRPSKSATHSHDTPGWVARIAIALVLSAVTVVVVGTGLSVAGFLALAPIVLALIVVTYGAIWVAWIRRRHVDQERRADILTLAISRTTPSKLGLTTNQALTLVVAVLLLGVGTVAAGVMPATTSTYSEAALLSTETGTALGTNGTAQLTLGQQNSVTLRLENHEGRTVTYGVVGVLQTVTTDGTVVNSREVDRGQITVADGETVHSERTFTPTRTEHRTRIQYLVYTGPIPENPTPENAALSLRVWIDADDGASA